MVRRVIARYCEMMIQGSADRRGRRTTARVTCAEGNPAALDAWRKGVDVSSVTRGCRIWTPAGRERAIRSENETDVHGRAVTPEGIDSVQVGRGDWAVSIASIHVHATRRISREEQASFSQLSSSAGWPPLVRFHSSFEILRARSRSVRYRERTRVLWITKDIVILRPEWTYSSESHSFHLSRKRAQFGKFVIRELSAAILLTLSSRRDAVIKTSAGVL